MTSPQTVCDGASYRFRFVPTRLSSSVTSAAPAAPAALPSRCHLHCFKPPILSCSSTCSYRGRFLVRDARSASAWWESECWCPSRPEDGAKTARKEVVRLGMVCKIQEVSYRDSSMAVYYSGWWIDGASVRAIGCGFGLWLRL